MSTVSDLAGLAPRWDDAHARRVVALRVLSSFAMGSLVLALPSFDPNRWWLAAVLMVAVPISSSVIYLTTDRTRVLTRVTIADAVWVSIAVVFFPAIYLEALLIGLALLASVASESHRALLATATVVLAGFVVGGVIHQPVQWLRLLAVFTLLLPLLVFVANVQRDRARQHRARMRHRAEHDGLTGLRNRAGFADVLVTTPFLSVIAVDLDGFKDINDTLGHEAGDELLVVLAKRLERAVGHRGVLARAGGDEFTIAVFVDDVDLVANDVLQACRRRVALADVDVSIGASLGIAAAVAGVDGTELLRRADLAMYEAKHNQGGIRHWTDSTRSASRTRVELSGEVEQAFEDGQFRLFFQPIVDIDTGVVVDVEGLLRWEHPTHGLLSPAAFLELVEAIGRRATMDRLVFNEAAALVAAVPESVGVSVNISAGSLMRSSLPVALEASLVDHGVSAERVTIEIIEDEMIGEQSTARTVLTDLGAMGVGIAIDDFGTGHSSLSRLRHLPVTALKIDRSFVSGVVSNDDDRAIVRAVADLGAALDLVVVAEGVESLRVRDELIHHAIRVDRIQGYGIAPPMPMDEAVAFITRSVETKHPTRVLA
ncbi:MAG: bifunctional diguanylate cyclase/phosphodiesterase [Actinomycetota bacterium]